ncbi:MAG: amidohydrolase family protein [Lentisphaerae bacterium]|nr:amidohydrolase family protein [Lentisphaerota bacterium]
MPSSAIVNCRIVGPDRVISRGVLLVQQGRIVACGPEDAVNWPPDADVVDAAGGYVAPGFIDIHCHGGGGHYVHDAPSEVADMHLRHGTTGLLATLVLLSQAEMLAGMARINAVRHPAILGLHLEGPYLSQKFGARREMSRLPEPRDYKALLEAAAGQLKIWTFAPELPGTDEFVDVVAPAGVVLSVGHSEACARRIYELVPRGLRLGCHCMCATGVTPPPMGGVREVGVDEAVMVHDDIYAEVIPDALGIHVRPLMLRLLLKAKGVDRTIIITDAVRGAGDNPSRRIRATALGRDIFPWTALTGMPDARYLNAAGREFLEVSEDVNVNELHRLAGSKLTMDQALRNMMRHTGVGIVEACRMAALTPATLLGLQGEVGSLEPGKKANLVLLSEGLAVQRVMLAGAWVA